MSDDGPSRRPASHVDASVERPRIWVTVDIWSEDSGPKRAVPESAIGGPLCLVRDGDVIALDVPGRSLTLDVPDEELTRRRAAWQAPAPTFERGYRRLYQRHVLRGHQGCDFDFPRLPSGATPGS